MIRYAVFFLCCLSFSIASKAASYLKVQEFITPSGVQARLVEDHSIPVISLTLLIQAGDVYDPLDKPYL
jgi:hypothetical protein